MSGFLSQPASLRHYLTAEVPAYLAPLRFLGVLDDLTDEFRLDSDGVSYVLPPSAELPYFYAANARDPRAGIAHEGAHYQQLSLSNAHPNPLRRRYYDSGPNEGIAFYNEEYLLQAGLFDDAPHTRAVIWNFARLRALRVEADVHLATGTMSLDDAVEFFVRRVPMDRQTAFEESCFYAGNPGLALSYQTGKLQLMSLVAAAAERDGDEFSLRRIHDAIWLDGNVPFSLLRWQLLDDRSVLDAVDADPATGAPTPTPAWARLMRVGAKLPNSGALPVELGIARMAGELEANGFASLWVSDHVVMPATVSSRYPYATDGVATWATDEPWFDAIVALSIAAAVTERAELGTAVLVLPQRQPGRPRQAGRQPGPARRRPCRPRCRGGVAGRGVRRPGHAVRLAGEPHRRLDRRPALVLDRPSGTLRQRSLPPAGGRRVPTDAGPPDPDPRWWDDEAGAAPSTPARRRLARHPAG